MLTYVSWLERCRVAKALAVDKLSDSYNFRESTRVMREHAWNDIKAQQDATDYTLRKRIYQTQKARNELDWQKLKVFTLDKLFSTFILINFEKGIKQCVLKYK